MCKNNAAADALSHINESLNSKEVKAILDGTAMGCHDWAEVPKLVGETEDCVQNLAVRVHKEEMHVIDWVEVQKEDPFIQKTIEWIQANRQRPLKNHLGDDVNSPEGKGFINQQKSLILVKLQVVSQL